MYLERTRKRSQKSESNIQSFSDVMKQTFTSNRQQVDMLAGKLSGALMLTIQRSQILCTNFSDEVKFEGWIREIGIGLGD